MLYARGARNKRGEADAVLHSAAEQVGVVGSTPARLGAFGWAREAGGENGSSNAEVGCAQSGLKSRGHSQLGE